MQTNTYHALANRQNDYWWHRARRKMAVALLRRYGAQSERPWLDLGCGPGGNLNISDAFQALLTIGIDASPLALELARQRASRASLVQADVNFGIPLTGDSCAVATIFNVLYHSWIPDEKIVLAEVGRVLRPGGLVLITEPAFSLLKREMDDAAMARRRFRRTDVTQLLRQTGFEVLFSSYFTSFGFPLLLTLKAIRPIRALRSGNSQPVPADMRPLSRPINEMMYAIAMAEVGAITHGIPMAFGTTVVCLARKS